MYLRTAGRKKAGQTGSCINQNEPDHAAVTNIPESQWWKTTDIYFCPWTVGRVSAPHRPHAGLQDSPTPLQGCGSMLWGQEGCGQMWLQSRSWPQPVARLCPLCRGWEVLYNPIMHLKGRELEYLSSTLLNTVPPSAPSQPRLIRANRERPLSLPP